MSDFGIEVGRGSVSRSTDDERKDNDVRPDL